MVAIGGGKVLRVCAAWDKYRLYACSVPDGLIGGGRSLRVAVAARL